MLVKLWALGCGSSGLFFASNIADTIRVHHTRARVGNTRTRIIFLPPLLTLFLRH